MGVQHKKGTPDDTPQALRKHDGGVRIHRDLLAPSKLVALAWAQQTAVPRQASAHLPCGTGAEVRPLRTRQVFPLPASQKEPAALGQVWQPRH